MPKKSPKREKKKEVTEERGAYSTNKSTLKQHQLDVLGAGRVGTDPKSGLDMTMKLGTIQLFDDGLEYIVPWYDPKTMKEIHFRDSEGNITPESGPWLDRWSEEAKKGNIVPYSTTEEAEAAMRRIRKEILRETRFWQGPPKPWPRDDR